MKKMRESGGSKRRETDQIATGPNLTPPFHMPDDPETYLAVLKAAYDYEPQADAEDELAIKENQVLFLLERVDDELSIRPSTSFLYFPSDVRSFSAVGGRSSQSKMTTLLSVWFPLHTLNKCGIGLPWHSVHHHLSPHPAA